MSYNPSTGVPRIISLGSLGAAFSPSFVANFPRPTIIKATVDAGFTMTNITVSDGAQDGMKIQVEFTQGAGGDITSWSANFDGSDLVPLTSVGLSVGAGKTDILIFEWDSTRAKWMLISFFNGVQP